MISGQQIADMLNHYHCLQELYMRVSLFDHFEIMVDTLINYKSLTSLQLRKAEYIQIIKLITLNFLTF